MNDIQKNRALVISTLVAWAFQIVYTLSPIDLIPDFIPFLGVLDDLLGLAGVVSMTFYVGYMMRNGGFNLLFESSEEGTPSIAGGAEVYEPMDPLEIKHL